MQYEHQRKRAKERYGLDLDPADIVEGMRQIREGEATLQTKDNGRGHSIYFVMLKGRVLRCVWRPTGMLITFLPLRDHRNPKRFKAGKPKERHRLCYAED